jgi:hypothetical protein
MRCAKLSLSIIILIALETSPLAQSRFPKLHPSRDYWDYVDEDGRRASVQISRLSQNRKLATVGDTLYMLDARNRIVWRWSSDGPPLTDLPIIDSTGTIYVIGYDLLWAAIDSVTGQEKWRGTANGRALYSQLKLYKNGTYLVVTNMEGYRESLSDRSIEDNLRLCRGNAILWETHIPAGAKIQVKGGKVFMLIRRNRHTLRQQVSIPDHFGNPIGKISAFADYD